MMKNKDVNMNWLEESKCIYENLIELEKAKPFRLTVRTENDILKNLDRYKAISFFSDYKGTSVETLLPDLIERATALEEINILSCPMTWDYVCSIDFSGVRKLTFLLNGAPSNKALYAPDLKELRVRGNDHLTPMELMLRPHTHINLHGLDELETLELTHIQQFDPSDIKDLSSLRNLTIKYSDLYDLEWLNKSSYQLEKLSIIGPIANCDGVQSHPSLTELELIDNCITDFTPIEELTQLGILDLRYRSDLKDSRLRNMGIKTILIDHYDNDVKRIQGYVHDLSKDAVMRYRTIENTVNGGEELPNYKKIIYHNTLNKPFDIVMKDYIQQGFDKNLESIETSLGFSISGDERKKIFINEATTYYPFLVIKQLDEV